MTIHPFLPTEVADLIAGILVPRRRRAILAAALLILGQWFGGRVVADDLDPLDRQLLEALEGTGAADGPEQIVPRLLEGTRTAAARLADGQLDQTTRDLQAQILADIDALLEQTAASAQSPQNQGADSRSGGEQSQDSQRANQENPAESKTGAEQASESESDPNAAARESQERTAQGQIVDTERERRLGLSTAAWGHLPPKVREQMRSAFSEEYLPQYDALVRRYYEALSRRRSADR